MTAEDFLHTNPNQKVNENLTERRYLKTSIGDPAEKYAADTFGISVREATASAG